MNQITHFKNSTFHRLNGFSLNTKYVEINSYNIKDHFWFLHAHKD